MDGRSLPETRRCTGAEAPQAKRSRRLLAPSGVDSPSEAGADWCRFSSPIPVESEARATERLVETTSGPVAVIELEETSGTAKHLSGIMLDNMKPPRLPRCRVSVLHPCLSRALTTTPRFL